MAAKKSAKKTAKKSAKKSEEVAGFSNAKSAIALKNAFLSNLKKDGASAIRIDGESAGWDLGVVLGFMARLHPETLAKVKPYLTSKSAKIGFAMLKAAENV